MDWFSFAIPAFLLAAAYSLALWVHRRLPGEPVLLKFHAVAYSLLLGLALIVVLLMANVQAVDLNVDDASMLLMVLFASLGVVLCLVLTALAWFLKRRGSIRPGTRYTINTLVCLPYVVTLLILLLYRE